MFNNIAENIELMYKSFISIAFLLLNLTALAQIKQDTPLTKSIDSLVSTQFAGNQPGISVLIGKKGQIIYKKAFGSANMELKHPNAARYGFPHWFHHQAIYCGCYNAISGTGKGIIARQCTAIY